MRAQLRNLLDEPSAQIFDLVDRDAVRRLVAADATPRRAGRTSAGAANTADGAGSGRAAGRRRRRWTRLAAGRGGVERVLALDGWLREYQPHLVGS
jgi:hypothetical protein